MNVPSSELPPAQRSLEIGRLNLVLQQRQGKLKAGQRIHFLTPAVTPRYQQQ
jgi:hypothetical protein